MAGMYPSLSHAQTAPFLLPMSEAGHCLSKHREKEEVKIVLKPPCRSPLLSKILLLRQARGASQTHPDISVP